MGKTAPTPQQWSALEEIKDKFNAWRNAKSGKRRIPDHLWQAAVTLFLAGGFSLNKIARELHLSHSDLRYHVEKQPSDALQSFPEAASTFIEIDPPSFFPECVIEMEDQSGTKIRMCFKGKADPGLVEIGKSFIKERV